mgnify:CR=1 FL=1
MDAQNIAALLANERDEEACQAICELAGLKDELDADDADNIIYKVASILGVEVYKNFILQYLYSPFADPPNLVFL